MVLRANAIRQASPRVSLARNSPESLVAPGENGVSSNGGSDEKAGVSERSGRTRGAEPSRGAGAVRDAGVSDGDLVRKACRGDREAFGELVLRHQDAVYGHAWRILKSREDAEDAAQESFLRAWRGLDRFDATRPFHPWILRIATNVALTARSRRRPHAELAEATVAENPSPTGLPSPAAAASRREILAAVQRMVEDLPPENAALFHLRYGEDLSLDEIARILDRRPGALAVTLHRIRERFRRALFGPEKGVDP